MNPLTLRAERPKDVRIEINEYLKDKGISRKHLARKIDVSNTHLGAICRRERILTQDILDRINTHLEKNFVMTEQAKPKVIDVE